MKGKKGKKESETPCKDTSQFEAVPVESKTPATVVLLLNSNEEDILIKACQAVHAFAEKGDENKVTLLGLGALEPLCHLITHSNKLVRGKAFMALGTMAVNGDVKEVLKKIDVIPSIIDKLSHEEETVLHEFATLCLACLSLDFMCKVQIFENKGLPPLIHLLSSPDPDVQKNSLEIIFNLVQDHQCRVMVHELGGIPPLLELLLSDYPVIQHLALETLQNITTDKDTRYTFGKDHGFEKIMDVLEKPDFSDLHSDALQVISNYLNDIEIVQLVSEGGGLTRLIDFFLAPSTPDIQCNSVKCIGKIAQIAENCRLLNQQNVEKVLVDYLSLPDCVKVSTCRAVAAMCIHLASKQRFQELGGIPLVVHCLKSECPDLREAAAHALAGLTHNSHARSLAVYEAGGHEFLIQMLGGICPRAVAHAAATLGNMASHKQIRCSILSHGAIPALVEPLKSIDTNVLVNTTRCLTMLGCDAEARIELQNAGGLHPLVDLLRSYNREVRQNACLAVNVCASDDATAVEMCKYGALELLQEIEKSVNRRSSISQSAMTNLLRSNLSVKYSLTGHLAATDIIGCGFYDAGEARAGRRVLTLEELSKHPVNHLRPILAINIVETKEDDDKQKDETQPASPAEKPWPMMDDADLQVLVKETRESILQLDDEREQWAALARLVSEAMGGAVEAEKLHEFPWVLHLSELKHQLHSNVIPIGRVTRGIYCHRALLFKSLADSAGMCCTLVRGEYNRAWNEVLLSAEPSGDECSYEPGRYIVDLMHQPGTLLAVNTSAAVKYQTL